MTNIEIDEALAILDRMLTALSACFFGKTGRAGFAPRRAIGTVRAKGESYLRNAELGEPLLACFATTREAGATFAQFDTVRATILAEAPVALIAVAVVQAGERYALAQMARVASATTFASRTDANATLERMNLALAPAEEAAADEHDTASYRAIIALHASVTRDLVQRAMLLPNVVNFSHTPSPALWVANRIYQNAARADEIVAENKIVHPAFCPRDLICLSQ